MLTQWIPNSEISPLFNRVFGDAFFRDVAVTPFQDAHRAWMPPADVVETEHDVKLLLDMPGLKVQDIHVQWEDDTLTVSAERKFEKQEKGQQVRTERRYGSYARSFVLPETVDGAQGQADYVHGVLTLTLPKKESAKPRTIDIKVAG